MNSHGVHHGQVDSWVCCLSSPPDMQPTRCPGHYLINPRDSQVLSVVPNPTTRIHYSGTLSISTGRWFLRLPLRCEPTVFTRCMLDIRVWLLSGDMRRIIGLGKRPHKPGGLWNPPCDAWLTWGSSSGQSSHANFSPDFLMALPEGGVQRRSTSIPKYVQSLRAGGGIIVDIVRTGGLRWLDRLNWGTIFIGWTQPAGCFYIASNYFRSWELPLTLCVGVVGARE